MESDPTPTPITVQVDSVQHTEITGVIVEEGVLTLVDTQGWSCSMAPGTWSKATRVDPRELPEPTLSGGDPRNLS